MEVLDRDQNIAVSLKAGLDADLFQIDEEQKYLTYLKAGIKQRLTNPEEPVRAEAYMKLVLEYQYPARRISFEVPVKMGSDTRRADIIVYEDDEKKKPFMIVETKKPDVSDAAFGEAVNQGFSYANALSANFVWVTSGLKSEAYDAKSFYPMERESNLIADIPSYGAKVARYKYAVGGVGGKELAKVSEDVLTRKFKQAHDALWAGGKRNPTQAFDELDKLIFCKLWDERIDRDDGEPYDFQVFTGEDPDDLLKRIQKLYEIGREKDPEVFQEDVRLTANELQTVVGYLAEIDLGATDLDSKGRAFEEFMDDFFRGEFGQYFTPRPIVKFIVDVLPITDQSYVLDTSCGSGGFLLYALDKVRSEAKQRLAESRFRGRNIPPEAQAFNYWHDFAEKRLYGIEISEMIARTAKMNMIIHDDGHTNVISFDGLQSPERMRSKTGNQGFRENHFDFITTNPPFGAKILSDERSYMQDYDLGTRYTDWIDAELRGGAVTTRDSQSSEVLFIEQCYRFLKPGGILAIVVPDGILTNSSLQYVRDWIAEKYRILGVVSMPQTAFTATGAGVKSSVMFLQKYSDAETAHIRSTKEAVQSSLFGKDEYGPAIARLEEEKNRVLKRGDDMMRQLEEAHEAHLGALGEIDKAADRNLKRELREKIKAHQRTDDYKEWRKATTDSYNERINAIKEGLASTFAEEVQAKLSDYPIFMAIAEDIGYDATGRATGKSELGPITEELSRFIGVVREGGDNFFAQAPA